MLKLKKLNTILKEDWKEFKYKFRHDPSSTLIKIINIFVFFTFFGSSIFLMSTGKKQQGIDILYAAMFFIIFIKLHNMETR